MNKPSDLLSQLGELEQIVDEPSLSELNQQVVAAIEAKASMPPATPKKRRPKKRKTPNLPDGDAHTQADLFGESTLTQGSPILQISQQQLTAMADEIVDQLVAEYLPKIEAQLKARLKPFTEELLSTPKTKN